VTTRLAAGVLVCAALVAAQPVQAHHSFAMFDTAKRVTMSGTVTAFEWTNPHAYIEIDVPDDKGVVKHWSVELGSTSILMQAGWKFNDIKVGDKITIVLSPLRSGESGGLLAQVTLRDGRVLGNGPGRVGGQP
jgi:hypothetical protein